MPRTRSKNNYTFSDEQSRWLMVVIVISVVLFTVFYNIKQFERDLAADTADFMHPAFSERQKAAIIELDFGGGRRRKFQGMLDGEGYPLLVAFDSAASAGKFTYTVRGDEITAIAGVSDRSSSASWNVYRNGAWENRHISELTIKGGDHYSFRYESR